MKRYLLAFLWACGMLLAILGVVALVVLFVGVAEGRVPFWVAVVVVLAALTYLRLRW